MIRSHVNFRVRGSNHAELIDKCTSAYRDFINDPEAELPWDFHIEISALDTPKNANGESITSRIVGWEAVASVYIET